MGPRSCERGNAIADEARLRILLLQWGRARASAEMCDAVVERHGGSAASMGPRSCERGNAGSHVRTASCGRLQWGRARASAEISARRVSDAGLALLQWGR